MRHAYCIIAHNEPAVLQKLIEAIDDERNDIFLMVDKKTDMAIFPGIRPKKSNLTLTERIDVRWGDVSQIVAELTLLEAASRQGRYQYYHLLSGVDLPIKSQDYIHRFMDEHDGTEFVGFAQSEFNKQDLNRKTRYYYILTRYYRSPLLVKAFCKVARSSFLLLQKVVGIKRHYDVELRKGVNWFSITHGFCLYLLARKDFILKTFRHVMAPDEMFVQTMLWQSEFKDRIYKPDSDFGSCLREIDWYRGNPYTWGGEEREDLNLLKHSEKLFARKFSSKYMDFIEKVMELNQTSMPDEEEHS